MRSSAPVDEADFENASDEEDPEELGSDEELLQDTRSIQEAVDLASSEPYSFPEDSYSNALMAMIKPSDSSTSHVMGVIAAMLFMVVIFAAQWFLTIAVSAESWKTPPVLLSAHHVLQRQCKDLGTPGLRIAQARSEEICGLFFWREWGNSGARAGSYEAEPDWDLFKEWVGDMPHLQELIYRKFGTSIFNNPFEGGYLIAICAWTSVIIAELREIFMFFYYAAWALPQGPVRFALRDDGGLLLKSLNWKHKIFVVLVALCRTELAVQLMWVGRNFLGATNNISDVILNAMALGFVLELDTIIFKAATACSDYKFLSSLRVSLTEAGAEPERVQESPRETVQVEASSPSEGSSCRGPICTCFWNSICIAAMLGVAIYSYRGKQQVNLIEWKLVSHVCLYGGPAPTLNNVYHEVFPVPGLCESLLKMDGLKNESEARVHVTKPGYGNMYIDELVEKCLDMFHNTSSISNERESDPDLADLNVTDTVGNFWCPGGNRFCDNGNWNFGLNIPRGFCK